MLNSAIDIEFNPFPPRQDRKEDQPSIASSEPRSSLWCETIDQLEKPSFYAMLSFGLGSTSLVLACEALKIASPDLGNAMGAWISNSRVEIAGLLLCAGFIYGYKKS